MSAQATNASSGRPTENSRGRDAYANSGDRRDRPAPSRSGYGNSSSQQSQPRRPARQDNPTGLRITYLQNPQVEIINHNQAKGQGIKKTLAYDTPLSKEQLVNWRKEFWGKYNDPSDCIRRSVIMQQIHSFHFCYQMLMADLIVRDKDKWI